MGSKKNEFKNSVNPEYIQKFDEICGLDMVSFHLNDESVGGYFDQSPLEKGIITKFDYIPTKNIEKPYRAHWMIHSSELLLGYVNGVFHGTRYYTHGIVSDLDKDEFLNHYKFTGQIKLIIQQQRFHPIFEPYLINKNELLLTFEKGVLVPCV